MAADYVLASRWTVPTGRDALWDVLEELLATDDPLVWWPSVAVESYDGQQMQVRATSRWGYSLTFSLDDLEVRRPDRLTFTSTGDLRGTGVVTFVERGDACDLDIDWRVATDRRWMRWSAWVLRPVFVAGHHRVMRQGQRHLASWIASSG